MSHGVHMVAILDFHEIQFLQHFDIPHQRKIIKHASLGVIYILKLNIFVSFASLVAYLAAILDFNEN